MPWVYRRFSCAAFTVVSTTYVSNSHNHGNRCPNALCIWNVQLLFVSSVIFSSRLLKGLLDHPMKFDDALKVTTTSIDDIDFFGARARRPIVATTAITTWVWCAKSKCQHFLPQHICQPATLIPLPLPLPLPGYHCRYYVLSLQAAAAAATATFIITTHHICTFYSYPCPCPTQFVEHLSGTNGHSMNITA